MSLQSRLRAFIAPKPPALEFVVQAGKASGDWVPLTVYDLLTGHFYTEQALFFSKTLDGKALRAALAQTLCNFPVLRQRLAVLRDRPDSSIEYLGLLFDVRRQLGLPKSYAPFR